MTIDEDFQKTEFQKVMTQWTFSQSTGIVMGIICIAIMGCLIVFLIKRIDKLEARMEEQSIYLRDKLPLILEPNTRALNENTRVMGEFNNYLRLKSFSK